MRLCIALFMVLVLDGIVAPAITSETGPSSQECPCKTFVMGICIEYENCVHKPEEASVGTKDSTDSLEEDLPKGVVIDRDPMKPEEAQHYKHRLQFTPDLVAAKC